MWVVENLELDTHALKVLADNIYTSDVLEL